MTLAQRLDGKRVCVCVGAGGVGKTTTAAALALGLARRGQRVAVVTIDPARRLAGSLGLERLGNAPALVDPALFERAGVEMRGELWAMMLDAKRTFDELIDSLAPDAAARDAVLANRIYQELSRAVAGSQEFTAVAKLYDLARDGRLDAIVLDTPPSRNALDFLEAPTRLTQFLEGRALRSVLVPTGLAARVVGRGTAPLLATLSRVTGVDLVSDLTAFLRSLAGMLDGFRERAREVDALLRDEHSTFLVVAAPDRVAAEEAIYLGVKLREAAMPLGAVIVNRMHLDGLDGLPPEAVADLLAEPLGERLARRVTANLVEMDALALRDRESVARLADALADPDPILVPDLGFEVSDIAGLAAVEAHLFAAEAPVAPASGRQHQPSSPASSL